MNFSEFSDRVYKTIENRSLVIFYLGYVVVTVGMVLLIDLFNSLVIQSDLMVRFELGLPLILQFILVYVIYRENSEKRVARFFYIATIFYTIVCSLLALYEFYFTGPSFGDDLIYYVVHAQILFQILLVALSAIFQRRGLIAKGIILKLILGISLTVIIVLMMHFYYRAADYLLFFWLIIATLTINVFNPVLIYIISHTAKGKYLM
jgi:hypothetical protein